MFVCRPSRPATCNRQSVLESVGGDQDRAIDLLLGMSDPNFKSEAPPIAAAPSPQMVCYSFLPLIEEVTVAEVVVLISDSRGVR